MAVAVLAPKWPSQLASACSGEVLGAMQKTFVLGMGSASPPAVVLREQSGFDPLIQPIQIQVSEHRAHDRALGHATERGVEAPVLQIPCLEQRPDQPQEAAVVNAFGQDIDQHLMRELVEELGHIQLDEPRRSYPAVVDLLQCGVAAMAAPKPVRVGRELRVIVGVQDQPEHLLQQLIGPGWQS